VPEKSKFLSFGSRTTSNYDWEVTFAGYRFDVIIGCYQIRNRMLHPGFGGWTQRDPLGLSAGINLYEYVHGNPLTYVDPAGTVLVAVIVVSGIVVLVLVTVQNAHAPQCAVDAQIAGELDVQLNEENIEIIRDWLKCCFCRRGRGKGKRKCRRRRRGKKVGFCFCFTSQLEFDRWQYEGMATQFKYGLCTTQKGCKQTCKEKSRLGQQYKVSRCVFG